MIFEPDHIYHIYNQGNNRQKIFFNRENYLYFLKKLSDHILPYADVLAWCLMPNHFHLMIFVLTNSESFTLSETLTTTFREEPFTNQIKTNSYETLNNSIGVLLRSYTRAINKQRNSTGSLFRKMTKAENISESKGFTQSDALTTATESETLTKKDHLQTCFDYIHQNPVKAGMVDHPEKWEFSSFLDYYGRRNGNLINRERASELGLF